MDVTKRLGRWLGVSHRVGSDLCYWLVTDSGQVVSKTSVEHVTRDDYLHEDTKKRIKGLMRNWKNVWMILTLSYREKMVST